MEYFASDKVRKTIKVRNRLSDVNIKRTDIECSRDYRYFLYWKAYFQEVIAERNANLKLLKFREDREIERSMVTFCFLF